MRKKEKKKCLSIRTAQAKRSFLEQSFKPSFPLERLVVLLHLFLLAPRAHSFSVTIVGPLLFISFLIPSHLSGCSLVYLIYSHLPLPAFADLLLILHLCLTDHNIFYLLLTQMLRQKLNKASACSRTPVTYGSGLYKFVFFSSAFVKHFQRHRQSLSVEKQFHFHLYRVIKLSG